MKITIIIGVTKASFGTGFSMSWTTDLLSIITIFCYRSIYYNTIWGPNDRTKNNPINKIDRVVKPFGFQRKGKWLVRAYEKVSNTFQLSFNLLPTNISHIWQKNNVLLKIRVRSRPNLLLPSLIIYIYMLFNCYLPNHFRKPTFTKWWLGGRKCYNN